MAIVNRTPDSFYDRGRTFALDRAIQAGVLAHEEGAEIIDIGGVPFAPGEPLPPEEESRRVIPLINELAKQTPVSLSVDTFHASVAERALLAGARIVNDTTGCSDPNMARVVAAHDAYLVITHSLAEPRRPYPRPTYDDVVQEVREFLIERCDLALSHGVQPERLIVDPGLDLNKNTLHSLDLVRNLHEIASLGLPVLSAPSHKDFVGESVGAPRQEREAASLTAAIASVYSGARIIRMHDVRPARQALDMLARIHGWESPIAQRHNMGEVNDPEDMFEPEE